MFEITGRMFQITATAECSKTTHIWCIATVRRHQVKVKLPCEMRLSEMNQIC